MREGEREVKLGREEISYNREKRVPLDSSQSRNCTNSSLAIWHTVVSTSGSKSLLANYDVMIWAID